MPHIGQPGFAAKAIVDAVMNITHSTSQTVTSHMISVTCDTVIALFSVTRHALACPCTLSVILEKNSMNTMIDVNES
jgi:hypothetical protein